MSRQWKLKEGKRNSSPIKVVLIQVLALLPLIPIFIAIITVAQRHDTEPQITTEKPFVTRSGTMLMVNSSSLRLIGYNWHWMGTDCSTPTDAEIDTTFSQIVTASHGNVIRTAFYQSGSNDGAYTDFDRYIQYAKHYGLYIVPTLVNQHASCEPAKTMERGRWYQAGYTQAIDGYPLSFRDYAIRLAQHYANEPTIAFWQLVNEPDAAPCGAVGAQTLRNFADDMTTALKTVDPHHMVDLGVPGQCAGDTPADYMQVVSGQVDLCDVWHDYEQIATPLPLQMVQRLNICQHLNKPSFVGESGICADVTASQTCSGAITSTSLHERATLFAAKLDAGFNMGLAGYILWNKGDKSVQSDIGPGDPTEAILAKYDDQPSEGPVPIPVK
jgi:mannan endo-1,4-beta-mannosidase